MRFAIIVICILAIMPLCSAADWNLEIIPTYQSSDKQSIDSRGQILTVLLTNVADHDLNIWTNEYSWGYDNLSFQVTRADGRSFNIVRASEVFTVNFAFPYLVKPGGHYAWAVTFSPDVWSGFPKDWKGSEEVTIKACFEVKPTKESNEMKVWTGKVESIPIKVDLIRFPKQVYFKRDYPSE